MAYWRKMDTAPRDRPILVTLWGDSHMVVEFDEATPNYPWCTLDGPSYHKDCPTHWRPLPNLPRKILRGG